MSRSKDARNNASADAVEKTKIAAAKAEKAVEFKNRGNDCVKAGQFKKAVEYYTEALRLNRKEPAHLTNRALCYIKLKRFHECVDDCTEALRLDRKNVKAYYRRMLAYEGLKDEWSAAMDDCRKVLELEPKNIDAQRSLLRLEKSLSRVFAGLDVTQVDDDEAVSSKTPWSSFENVPGYELIDFRSIHPSSPADITQFKQPLKFIEIGDGDGKKTTVKTNPQNQAQTKDCTPKPKIDLIQQVDPMMETDDTIQVTMDQTKLIVEAPQPKIHPAKPKADQIKPKIEKNDIDNEENNYNGNFDFGIPQNSAQFYRAWKAIPKDSHKFNVLKVNASCYFDLNAIKNFIMKFNHMDHGFWLPLFFSSISGNLP